MYILSCRAAKAPRPSNGTLLMWPPLWWPCLPKIDSGGPELPLTDGTFHLGSAPLCSVTFIQGYKNTVLVLQSKLKYYLQVISEVRHSDNIWWNKNAYWTCKKSPVAIIGQSDGKICITIQVVVIQTIIKEGAKCSNGYLLQYTKWYSGYLLACKEHCNGHLPECAHESIKARHYFSL